MRDETHTRETPETIYLTIEAKDVALGQARGCYQRALLLGQARWSGADLRGKAKRYGARYRASRAGLLRRLTSAGIEFWFERGPNRRKILVVERVKVQ